MFIDDSDHTKYKNPRNQSNYLVSITFYLIRKSPLFLGNIQYIYQTFYSSIEFLHATILPILFFLKKTNINWDSYKNVGVIADDCSYYKSSYSSEI